MTEDKMVGWHYRLNEYDFEQAPGDGEGLLWCAAVHGVTKIRTRLSDLTTSQVTKRIRKKAWSTWYTASILVGIC